MFGTGTVELLVVLAAVVLVGTVLVLLLRTGSRDRPCGRHARTAPEALAAPPDERPLPAVVVNPTKFDDLADVRRRISRTCTRLGWDPPLWLETTQDDPGIGQATEAVRRGADVVMACGGDGTVRCVGEALAGKGVAMALLPAGTGNLLARNLDLHLDDLEHATQVALTGDDRLIDVGRIAVDDSETERVFLVMAGMGFDAEIMTHVPEALKARVGPVAYTVAGLRQLKGRQVRVRLSVDGEEGIARRIRTVVVGNCGRLLGGVALMPDAQVDDGWLDMVSIAPEGIVGWVGVAGRVLTKQRKGHRRVEHWRAKAFTISAEQPQPAQLDGDPIGDVTSLRVRVQAGALPVRIPARPSS
jgi:diacylglycerol kinase (ATP)